MKNLNARPETIKLLEEDIRVKLCYIHHGVIIFFYFDTKCKGNRSKNKEMGLHQSKKQKKSNLIKE